MALDKQAVPVSFTQGVETKTDPKQVALGKLLKLVNAVMTTVGQFTKRNGYQALSNAVQGGGTLSTGQGMAAFQHELVAFDPLKLYSFSPPTQQWVDHGPLTSVDVSAQAVVRSATSQTVQTQAAHPLGLTLVAWEDSDGTAKYLVQSQSTGQTVVGPVTLPSSAVTPKCFALGNYLVVTYAVNLSGTWHLEYVALPVTTPASPTAPANLSNLVSATHPNYDGVVGNGLLYLTWNGSDTSVRTTYLSPTLGQGHTVASAGETADAAISCFVDSTAEQLWVAYSSGTTVRYEVWSKFLLPVLAPTTAVGSLSGVNGVTGWADSGSGQLLYQTHNTYSYSSVRTDYVSILLADSAGTVGSPSVLQRGVALASRVFSLSGTRYVTVAYGGALQPTYFVLDLLGRCFVRLAYSNGGGYPAKATLTDPSVMADGSVQLAYLRKDLLETQAGTVFTQTGVNLAQLATGTPSVLATADFGLNLNVSGGFLWAYDGQVTTEQNFHLFPEDVKATTSGSGGSIAANTYQYVFVYTWTDAKGNRHQSSTSVPSSVTTTGTTSTNTIKVPTLRTTYKTDVTIVGYRDTPSLSVGTFYQFTSLTSPTLSDSTVDSVTFTDTAADASLVGNPLLYTTGGVVDNTGGPSSKALTVFNDRLMSLNAEDNNRVDYSKQVVEGEPVQFADGFSLFVPPIPSKAYDPGRLVAISGMDDKLVLLRENGLFYLTGLGPDDTEANNDFSESTFITGAVGCVDPRSVVLIPSGLMFKSHEGIWLLGRDLSTHYLGSPVEAFNDAAVTSAVLVPNTTQVRFTLDTGVALVYDYFVGQWAEFSNHDAVAAASFQGEFTYLQPGGVAMQETPGQYSDAGQAILMSLTTSWVSLAGIRGYQRAYRLYLLGEYLTPHLLEVDVAYDFNSNSTQHSTYDPSSLANPVFGADPLFGSGSPFGGGDQTERVRVDLARQQCEAFQVTISEKVDTRSPTPGAGLTLSAILFLVGAKSSYPRQQPSPLTGGGS